MLFTHAGNAGCVGVHLTLVGHLFPQVPCMARVSLSVDLRDPCVCVCVFVCYLCRGESVMCVSVSDCLLVSEPEVLCRV